ncbi:hypothetical protein BHE74_00003019 [Ensete ventricosum]|nr:hypothetical protein BHE74_00003019 [Ensete ventricosum]
MERALGSGSASRRLARRISCQEEMPRLRLAASSCKRIRSGAGAFIVGATDRSYLRSLLSLLLTMSSYFTTPSVVLAARRASCFLQLWRVDLVHLTRVRSTVRLLTPPCLCQVGFTVSGRPRWRSSCPKARGRLGDPEASPSGVSSGPLSLVDTRVLRDLEVMKVDYDLDMAVTEESLAIIRKRYSIPTEYGLHVLRSGQRPYSSNAPGVCISVDALEAGLRFPIHPLIE